MLSSLINYDQEQSVSILSVSFVIMYICLLLYLLVDLGFFNSWNVVIPYSAHAFYRTLLINIVYTYAYNPHIISYRIQIFDSSLTSFFVMVSHNLPYPANESNIFCNLSYSFSDIDYYIRVGALV